MHFLFFLGNGLRVAGGGGGVVLGVWRVACGVWCLACGALRFIFFGRCLALQLSPPPDARTGGVGAAAAAGGGWPAPGGWHRTPSGCSATKSVQTGSYAPNA